MLSVTTFDTFLRECSPLERCAGSVKKVLLGRPPILAAGLDPRQWFGRGHRADLGIIRAFAMASACRMAQLAIDSFGSQVGHHVVRFTSIRDCRAAVLAAAISVGMRSPVPKYISSGV